MSSAQPTQEAAISGGGQRRAAARNVITNLMVLLVQSVAAVWFTPYLISKLGVELYGLVPLAMAIATYLSIITVGVQSAIGRFLTMAIAADKREEASSVFSTAVLSNIVLAAGIVVLALGLGNALPSLIEVPKGFEDASRAFFVLAITSYAFVTLREVLSASAFAVNRLDLQNVARVTEIFLRVAIPVAAFTILVPKIEYVGVGMAVGSMTSLVVAVVTWRRVVPWLQLSVRFFDRARFKLMVSMSGWITLTQAGNLLHLAVDLLVINVILGVTIAGRFGAVTPWGTFLRSFAGAFSAVLAPVVFAQYARKDSRSMQVTAMRSVKLLALGIGLPVAIVGGLSRPLLGLWLGPGFVDLWPILVASIIHLTANFCTLPLNSVLVAENRVKWPGIVTLGTGVLNLGLSIAWVRFGNDALGVALATVVALTLKNTMFTPLYAAKVVRVPWYHFYRPMVPGVVLSLVTLLVVFWGESFVAIDSWWMLIAGALALCVPYAALAWGFLESEERSLVLSLARSLSRGN